MKVNLDDVAQHQKDLDDLEEFMGALINGVSMERAIAQVWPDVVQPQPRRYASDVNGMLIGWDLCGGCGKHVSRCTCKAGPSEPAYFARLREEDAKRKAIAAGEHPELASTGVRSGSGASSARSDQASSTSAQPEEEPSTPNTASTTEPTTSAGSSSSSLVPCKVGKHLVSPEEADRNDDGSWTCFEHQAGAALRDGTGDE